MRRRKETTTADEKVEGAAKGTLETNGGDDEGD
jgi:hypothetical protein